MKGIFDMKINEMKSCKMTKCQDRELHRHKTVDWLYDEEISDEDLG